MNSDDAPKLPYRPTIQQAAEYLNVNPKSIRRYISQGRLTAVRVGPRLIRVERDSLIALAQPKYRGGV